MNLIKGVQEKGGKFILTLDDKVNAYLILGDLDLVLKEKNPLVKEAVFKRIGYVQ